LKILSLLILGAWQSEILTLIGDFCHQGRQDTEIAKKDLRLSKPTDMTIHWKALEGTIILVRSGYEPGPLPSTNPQI
jgi:hypothetical protein